MYVSHHTHSIKLRQTISQYQIDKNKIHSITKKNRGEELAYCWHTSARASFACTWGSQGAWRRTCPARRRLEMGIRSCSRFRVMGIQSCSRFKAMRSSRPALDVRRRSRVVGRGRSRAMGNGGPALDVHCWYEARSRADGGVEGRRWTCAAAGCASMCAAAVAQSRVRVRRRWSQGVGAAGVD